MSEIEPPSYDIERRPQGVVVPQQEADHSSQSTEDAPKQDPFLDEEIIYDWSKLAPALQRHKVTVTCLTLIVLSVVWKAVFISHYSFQQDDFDVFDVSLHSKLSWSYLTYDDAGHLFPGVYATAWVLARSALYSWAAASAVTVAMTLAASLAAWRALRILLGNRPAIVIPLTLYLLSPLAFPVYTLWITAMEAVPLQIALLMALSSHVRYVRSGSLRHALAAAGWIFFGLIFDEKSAVIPLLLFAITAGFLVRGPLLPAMRTTLRRLWRSWGIYLVLLAGYASVLIGAMRAANTQEAGSSIHDVAIFLSTLMRETFLPGVFGGPWKWTAVNSGTTVMSAPPSFLVFLSVVAALGIVVASILVRRRAWRAWAILAGWIVVADVVPLALGRLSFPGFDSILGLDPRYVFDAAPVLAITVALAFWPVAEIAEPATASATARRDFFGGRWKPAALGLTGVFVIGSIWTMTSMEDVSNGNFVRSYLATAEAGMAQLPNGTAIYGSGDVPPDVTSALFGKYAQVSELIRPVSHRGAQLRWLAQPYGTIDNLMAFSQETGQLYQAAITQNATISESLTAEQACNSPSNGRITILFPRPTSIWTDALQIGYLASPAIAGQDMTVLYGNLVRHVRIKALVHAAWVPVTGVVSQVIVEVPTAPPPPVRAHGRNPKVAARGRPPFDFCVAQTVTAGDIAASGTGTAYPAIPVSGS